jgi:hypothetical protein
MSSLWTPGGEHPVGREDDEGPIAPPADDPLAGLSPEERAQAEAMAEEMAAARQRVVEAPADMVVANHVMGLYELAAIHLSAEQPDLDAARLAIDAMAALVDGLESRLGEAEPTLKEALGQLRLAYVQVSQEGGGED